MIYIVRVVNFLLTTVSYFITWMVPLCFLIWIIEGTSAFFCVSLAIIYILVTPIMFIASRFLLERGIDMDENLAKKLK